MTAFYHVNDAGKTMPCDNPDACPFDGGAFASKDAAETFYQTKMADAVIPAVTKKSGRDQSASPSVRDIEVARKQNDRLIEKFDRLAAKRGESAALGEFGHTRDVHLWHPAYQVTPVGEAEGLHRKDIEEGDIVTIHMRAFYASKPILATGRAVRQSGSGDRWVLYGGKNQYALNEESGGLDGVRNNPQIVDVMRDEGAITFMADRNAKIEELNEARESLDKTKEATHRVRQLAQEVDSI